MAIEPIEIRENVTAGFLSLLDAAEDMSPAMMAIAAHLEASIRERFETGTAPDGTAWKVSKRVEEEGGKTLVLSGDLQSSIGSDFGPDFAAAGPEKSFASAIYAAIHQFSGTITPRADSGKRALRTPAGIFASIFIPAREYVGLSAEDRDVIRDHISAHFESKVKPR